MIIVNGDGDQDDPDDVRENLVKKIAVAKSLLQLKDCHPVIQDNLESIHSSKNSIEGSNIINSVSSNKKVIKIIDDDSSSGELFNRTPKKVET